MQRADQSISYIASVHFRHFKCSMELAGKERRKKWSEASKVEAIAIYNCRDAGTMQKASQEIPVPQPRLFPSQAQDANLSLFLLAHSNARSINTEFLPVPRAMQSGQEFARTANPANPCCVALAQSGLLYKNASLSAAFTHRPHGLVCHHGACLHCESSAHFLLHTRLCSHAN